MRWPRVGRALAREAAPASVVRPTPHGPERPLEPAPRGCAPHVGGMFFFFSNKLGCLGSILVSLALSALLYFLVRGF